MKKIFILISAILFCASVMAAPVKTAQPSNTTRVTVCVGVPVSNFHINDYFTGPSPVLQNITPDLTQYGLQLNLTEPYTIADIYRLVLSGMPTKATSPEGMEVKFQLYDSITTIDDSFILIILPHDQCH